MVRLALGVLAIAAFAYQIAASWNLAHEALIGTGVQRAPFFLRPGSREVVRAGPAAAAAGMARGDEVIAVNGEELDGANDLRRAVADERPIAVRWRGPAGERTATMELETIPWTEPSITNAVLVVIVGIVTPFICLLIGFAVVAIRPHDVGAWILLLLMLSFSQLVSIREVPVGTSWPLPLAALGAGWRPLWASLWGLAMALFGIYFPTRLGFDLRFPWLKWLLVIPFVILATGFFVLVAGDAERFGLFPFLGEFMRRNGWSMFWLNSLGVSVFFFCFGFRRGSEKNPDAKRRLNLIWTGSMVALIPIFATIVAGRVLRMNPFADFPVWLEVPVLLLLFVFPATLAYVIVVHRAMDVRVVVRQGLQYAMARRGLVILQIVVMALAIWIASDIVLDPATSRGRKVQAIAIAMAAAVLSRRGIERIRNWIDRKFFRDAVDAERVLSELGQSVRGFVEPQPMVKRVADVVRDTLRVEQVAMFLNGELQYATGDTFPEEIRVPLSAKEKTFGFMVLGPKKNEEPYSRSDMRLLETVAGQTALALENSELTLAVAREASQRERMNREIEIAREVQQKLFPQNWPVVEGVELSAHCRPAQSVGGDYFDFIPLPNGNLGIAIGDVSGKGIPAALLMASLQACLRGQTMDGATDLSHLMSNVNRLIFDASPVNRYATLFYGQYDRSSRKFAYVNAGHNPPVVLRGDRAIQLVDGGPVVGLFRPAKYQQGELIVEPGDIFIGFTDGVSEAMNSDDDEWGEDQLVATARRVRSQKAEEMIEDILHGADAFANGAPQHDDMTLIVAKFR